MNTRLPVSILAILTILAFAPSVFAQTDYSKSIRGIISLADTAHLRPRTIDDDFAELVFDETMKSLDPNGLIFTLEDYEGFKRAAQEIDTELTDGNMQFAIGVFEVYADRLKAFNAEITAMSDGEVDMTVRDSVLILDYPCYVSEDDLALRRLRWYKYQVLTELAYRDSSTSEDDITGEEIAKAGALIKARVLCGSGIDNTEDLNEIRNRVYHQYTKAVAKAFDPHTNYFSASEERRFASLISSESKSFGFDITLGESGFVEVAYVLPGGPAWNSNLINEGDLVMAIESEDNPKIEGFCGNIGLIADFLNDPKVEGASFKLKKRSGKEFSVELVKGLVDVEENNIQGYVLNGEKKVGYIYLPSFYTNEEESYYQLPNGCANDVAKELIQLQNEGIEALIMDLRDNGGGSMLEAIRLAGLFIDHGTLGIAASRGEEPISLKDLDRGVVTDLPLVVLVNEFSASASELFSASIQDLHRGLIVGSNTFGKSTMQVVLPLLSGNDGAEFLKLTVGEFYRTTGNPIQQKGVAPDVDLPSIYDRSEYSEKSYPSSLASESVDKDTYYEPLSALPIAKLKGLSEKRVTENEAFKEVLEFNKADDSDYVPLSLQEISEFQYESDEDEDTTESAVFQVNLPSYRELFAFLNPSAEADLEDLRSWMETDIYLDEAYQITIDLINLQ